MDTPVKVSCIAGVAMLVGSGHPTKCRMHLVLAEMLSVN